MPRAPPPPELGAAAEVSEWLTAHGLGRYTAQLIGPCHRTSCSAAPAAKAALQHAHTRAHGGQRYCADAGYDSLVFYRGIDAAELKAVLSVHHCVLQ